MLRLPVGTQLGSPVGVSWIQVWASPGSWLIRGMAFAAPRAVGVAGTGLPNAAKTSNIPAEQSAKPSTTRGIKKADRASDFFFIAIYLKVVRANPDVSRFSLRKEGQVAWLESPNGLGATTGFQLRGEVSRTKFPPILCRPSRPLGYERTDKPLFA